MGIYRPDDPTYNLARAAYENVRREQGWPDWDDRAAEKYREMMLRIARERHGYRPRRRRLLARVYFATRAFFRELRG